MSKRNKFPWRKSHCFISLSFLISFISLRNEDNCHDPDQPSYKVCMLTMYMHFSTHSLQAHSADPLFVTASRDAVCRQSLYL